MGLVDLHNLEHDFCGISNAWSAISKQLGGSKGALISHYGSPGARPQESFEILTFLDGLKFQQLDLAIISDDYKTISRFDFKVSNLEFRNVLEELQVRIETKQLWNVSCQSNREMCHIK